MSAVWCRGHCWSEWWSTYSEMPRGLIGWVAGKCQIIKHGAAEYKLVPYGWIPFCNTISQGNCLQSIDHLMTVTMVMLVLENQFLIYVPECIISHRDYRREGQEEYQKSAGESNWPSIIPLQLIHQQTLPMIQTSNALNTHGQLATNWEYAMDQSDFSNDWTKEAWNSDWFASLAGIKCWYVTQYLW